ncbi:Zinc finger protein 3 [Platanthera zijinensis]|uniref:Zinc finger protein 3 n=1 Tax=Platanthera zijinensis TaxID=2320716 RepID=A0AAP0G8N5_9ASPA
MANVEEGEAVGRGIHPAKVFSCIYCDRVFATSQALGGHQNGHRREREIVKRAQRHAQLLANPMHPSLRFAAPYIDGSSAVFYGVGSSTGAAGQHLLAPPRRMVPTPPHYYHPYAAVVGNYYGERRAAPPPQMHQPTLTLMQMMPPPPTAMLNVAGNGGDGEDRGDGIDLNLRL